eukprot:scaffold2206_cov316-Pavlova_lutheri.AAC.7
MVHMSHGPNVQVRLGSGFRRGSGGPSDPSVRGRFARHRARALSTNTVRFGSPTPFQASADASGGPARARKRTHSRRRPSPFVPIRCDAPGPGRADRQPTVPPRLRRLASISTAANLVHQAAHPSRFRVLRTHLAAFPCGRPRARTCLHAWLLRRDRMAILSSLLSPRSAPSTSMRRCEMPTRLASPLPGPPWKVNSNENVPGVGRGRGRRKRGVQDGRGGVAARACGWCGASFPPGKTHIPRGSGTAGPRHNAA